MVDAIRVIVTLGGPDISDIRFLSFRRPNTYADSGERGLRGWRFAKGNKRGLFFNGQRILLEYRSKNAKSRSISGSHNIYIKYKSDACDIEAREGIIERYVRIYIYGDINYIRIARARTEIVRSLLLPFLLGTAARGRKVTLASSKK